VFGPFAEYTRLRLADDPHLWASTLFDEVTGLGYPGSLNRPGSGGGTEATGEWFDASTEEVSERVA
jgi:hypothetical protein